MATRRVEFDSHRLQLAREVKGWTQQELAEKLDITKQQISAWETGSKGITVGSLERILNILECPVQFFFVRSDDDTSSTQAA